MNRFDLAVATELKAVAQLGKGNANLMAFVGLEMMIPEYLARHLPTQIYACAAVLKVLCDLHL